MVGGTPPLKSTGSKSGVLYEGYTVIVQNAKNATQKRIKNYKNDNKWKILRMTLTKYKHLFFSPCYQNQKVFSHSNNNKIRLLNYTSVKNDSQHLLAD